MACGCSNKQLTDEHKKILQALRACAGPCTSKDIAAATGLDAKLVSAGVTALKKQGYMDSPVRCKCGITAAGLAVINI